MDAYETTIYTAVLITALVLGCIIIYFAFSIFKHQRKHIEMQRFYFLNEINLLEKERTRIARDLHDEIGPLLSVTRFQISSVQAEKTKDQTRLEKANENLETIIERLGQISRNLTPTSLTKKGLHFALKDFTGHFEGLTSIKIHLIYEIKNKVPSFLTIHIYRIIQEVVHNSIKHSKGTELLLQLKEKQQVLYILCKDNGIGFNQDEETDKQEGIGLRSLKSRTGMLAGKMKCTTEPGQGTAYFFEIPLKQKDG